MNQRRRHYRLRKPLVVLIVCTAVFVMFTLCLNSFESALNIRMQEVEKEIAQLEAKKDGLTTARQEKVSFDHIVAIAKKNGYSLNYAASEVAAVTPEE